MGRFSDEIKIISPIAWVIAVVVYVCMAALLLLVPFQTDPKMSVWPGWAEALFVVCVPLPVAVIALLVGYVNADARRRGMRYILWTLLAVLVPNAIGIVLYFVLRDPIKRPCPQCGTPVGPGFAFCPKCGAGLGLACPVCRSPVEPGWSHCVKCGANLRATAS
jgi:hypothetical protein